MGRILSLILLAVLTLGLAACRPASESQPELIYYNVTYSVTATAATANIEFIKESGHHKEVFNATIPWSDIVEIIEGNLAYLSATSNQAASTITVTITYDEGILLDTATNGPGDFLTATAMGYLPE